MSEEDLDKLLLDVWQRVIVADKEEWLNRENKVTELRTWFSEEIRRTERAAYNKGHADGSHPF
jgi:hypothetical protein